MKLFLTTALYLWLLLPVAQLFAAEMPERPKIGLALSGGGARGGAHVGVLKALEKLNVSVDYIAGTSMGAIIGGFYAAGYSADEIEELLQGIDWSAALSDTPDRRNQTMRKKELDASFLIPYKVGFNKGSIQLPLGVIEGQHLDQILQRILFAVENVTDFSQLQIPFNAVATDLVTGNEVVLSSGSLVKALRASMSVPGVFAPVRLNDQLLVDGGMSNNLPVSVVRAMGADIVIAVDIASPMLRMDQLKSVLSVTEQLTNFLTRKNTQEQIASLGPRDILLVPDLGEFSSADFERAPEIVEMGMASVLEYEDSLVALSTQTSADRQDMVQQTPPVYVVKFIDIRNESVLNDEIIRSRLQVEVDEPLNIERLETSLDQIYSLNVFESVTYELIRNDALETGLLIHAISRQWGPNYLQVGLEFSDDFSGNSAYKVGAAYTRNALNGLGGELRILASLGREDELSFDFYQPVDKQARWFIRPQVFGRRETYNIFVDDFIISELEISGLGASLGIGRNFNTTNLLWLNYEIARGKANVLTGNPGFPLDDDVEIGEMVLRYRHDSLDSFWFPTNGSFHLLGYRYAADELGAAFDYQQAFGSGTISHSWGKNTLLINYAGGYSFDDAAPIERWYELGGFGRLSGLLPDQLSGRHMGLATLAYYRRLNDIDLIPAYAGVTLETGNVWDYSDDISFNSLRTSGSIFIGAETFIGPVYLAWGYSEGGDSAFYFYLGNPFRGPRF